MTRLFVVQQICEYHSGIISNGIKLKIISSTSTTQLYIETFILADLHTDVFFITHQPQRIAILHEVG